MMEFSVTPYSFFLKMIIFTLIQLHKTIEANKEYYDRCQKPLQCGEIYNIKYPFYDDDHDRPAYCGYPGFKLSCDDDTKLPEIEMTPSDNYYLLSTDPDSSNITVCREEFWKSLCPSEVSDNNIDFKLFKYSSTNENVTFFYECPTENTVPSEYQFSCPSISKDNPTAYFMTKTLESRFGYRYNTTKRLAGEFCAKNISIPILKSLAESIKDVASLQKALETGFQLEWIADNQLCKECSGSGGECGYNTTTKNFTCYCSDQPYPQKCPGFLRNSGQHIRLKIFVVACSAIGAAMLIVLALYIKRNCSLNNQLLGVFEHKKKPDVEALLKNYGATSPKRYAYRDLQRITNSFKDKLGEGGFGVVYRGRIHSGHQVAVKILKKSKGDAEDFINEVLSTGKTNHINIVRLVGFCYEGQKRALVYDFMPNGSLEKFIYGRNNHQLLALKSLFQIAVGVARGLEYLHRGCNTRMLHFDIKPHNILLDENFCPKISDFGLAKSFVKEESIISLSVARGTAGYIAPEVFFKSFGGVSQKSDIYSYGMLVLEMVGCGKKATDRIECSSEHYFSQLICKQLQKVQEFDYEDILSGEERELQRKLVLMSLWCIQTHPSSRPTMTRVVEMLEGPIESMPIPPMPSLSSQHDSSTTPTISVS